MSIMYRHGQIVRIRCFILVSGTVYCVRLVSYLNTDNMEIKINAMVFGVFDVRTGTVDTAIVVLALPSDEMTFEFLQKKNKKNKTLSLSILPLEVLTAVVFFSDVTCDDSS